MSRWQSCSRMKCWLKGFDSCLTTGFAPAKFVRLSPGAVKMPFCWPLFFYSSVVKHLSYSSKPVKRLDCQTVLKSTHPPNLTGWIHPWFSLFTGSKYLFRRTTERRWWMRRFLWNDTDISLASGIGSSLVEYPLVPESSSIKSQAVFSNPSITLSFVESLHWYSLSAETKFSPSRISSLFFWFSFDIWPVNNFILRSDVTPHENFDLRLKHFACLLYTKGRQPTARHAKSSGPRHIN